MADAGLSIIIGTVISAAAAGMSAISSAGQARQQAALSRQNAAFAQQMSERNKAISDQVAQHQRDAGEYQASLIREKAQKMLGKQMALSGASGVDLLGSPVDVMGETAGQYERDAMTSIYNANYDAWKTEMGGENSLLEGSATAARYRTEASMQSDKADMAMFAAPLMVGSSLITGWGRYKMGTGGYNSYGSPSGFDASTATF